MVTALSLRYDQTLALVQAYVKYIIAFFPGYQPQS